jgi:hypothetical protein
VVVDPAEWAAIPALEVRVRPRVLHRPSRSIPPIKGSDVIVPVLEELHRLGIIERIEDPGQIAADQMPALVASADIVVDQIRTGSYGVAAVEAMMAGRVVVGNIAADVRAAVPDEIPIVDADPGHLADVLTEIAGDWPGLIARGQAGREFSAKWHSGARSATTLTPFLES